MGLDFRTGPVSVSGELTSYPRIVPRPTPATKEVCGGKNGAPCFVNSTTTTGSYLKPHNDRLPSQRDTFALVSLEQGLAAHTHSR
jgi:hypothetical protein